MTAGIVAVQCAVYWLDAIFVWKTGVVCIFNILKSLVWVRMVITEDQLVILFGKVLIVIHEV